MNKVPSDIEIARAAASRPFGEIGDKLEIPSESLLPYGPTKAKISGGPTLLACPCSRRAGRTAPR